MTILKDFYNGNITPSEKYLCAGVKMILEIINFKSKNFMQLWLLRHNEYGTDFIRPVFYIIVNSALRIPH